ncbi:TIGR02281 family clan AA aspartic protease [Phaeobacter sp. NW0010-22]|uniref:retropepsin-like aspartic protease family protein n=1 Tax=Phaeobacter sp. NW0010-22 TaxID=3135907 RepID=UPI00310B9239
MDGENTARLVYLSLLAAALVFWFIAQNRASLGKTMQHALAWVFIFVGVIAVIGLWEDIRTTVSPAARMTASENAITVPRGRDGHYYLQLKVNGTPVDFLVDTGASQIVLSHADAEKIGIDLKELNYFGRALTANGEVRTAPAVIEEIVLGPFRDQGISAWVNEGEMDRSLLGMEYLQRFSSFAITDGNLILSR